MKKFVILLSLLATFVIANEAQAQYVNVKGYTKSNGTYVAPHVRTKADGVKWNNLNQ